MADVREALKAAVGSIYFADSSDYGSGLWGVVRALAPCLVPLLESDPRIAYDLLTEDDSILRFAYDCMDDPTDLEILDFMQALRQMGEDKPVPDIRAENKALIALLRNLYPSWPSTTTRDGAGEGR
jgi:hypothetical protein